MRIRTFLMVSLTLIFANFDALAQESASAIAIAPGYQRLTGEIKWKKDLGVPPTEPGSTVPSGDICQSFYVIAVPPNSANNVAPISSDTSLLRGRDDELYHRCKYQMALPHGQQFTIRPGIGDVSTYWHHMAFLDTKWIGGSKLTRVFDKSSARVTLGRAKATWLAFELGHWQDLSTRTRSFYNGTAQAFQITVQLRDWTTPPMDWCREWETNCGKPAADAFCRSWRYDEAKKFEKLPNVPKTATITEKRVCDKSVRGSCDSFAMIECVRK